MVKDKRKDRTAKSFASTGTDFVGFSAFADSSEGTSVSTIQRNKHSLDNQLSECTPNYGGKDERFLLIFSRIRQKRDSVTICRSLTELQVLVDDDAVNKPVIAESLPHWAWLYHKKLNYDSCGTVRALSILTWILYQKRVPKVCLKTALSQPEVLGMLYCGQVDPSIEVRSACSANPDFFPTNKLKSNTPEWPWQLGLTKYVSRILSYEQPITMHNDLFARKNDKSDVFTSVENDALEERYEGIVSTALCAMECWIRSCRLVGTLSEGTIPIEAVDSANWWKSLLSNKPNLRRNTYVLLGTVASQVSYLLPPDVTIVERIINVIASETEPSNFPGLLELLLALLVGTRRNEVTDQKRLVSPWKTVVNPLAKVLRKACYGARDWAHILLPLSVELSKVVCTNADDVAAYDSAVIITLIKAMLVGQDSSLGESNRYQILASVCECSSFQLLRKMPESHVANPGLALGFIKLWLKAFEFALYLPKKNSILSSQARTKLLQQIAHEMFQFQGVTISHSNVLFTCIGQWFWINGLCLSSGDIYILTELVQCLVVGKSQRHHAKIHWEMTIFPFRQQAGRLIKQYQAVPNEMLISGGLALIIAIFEYCETAPIFWTLDDEDQTAVIERFVINDLLKWTIICATQQPKYKAGLEECFRLVGLCLKAVQKQSSLWDSFLSKLIEANCDLELIVDGISVLLHELDRSCRECLKCDALDELAICVGTTQWSKRTDMRYSSIFEKCNNGDGQDCVAFYFYKLCLCFHQDVGRDNLLIHVRVVELWIESLVRSVEINDIGNKHFVNTSEIYLCNHLLQALLLTIAEKRSILNESHIEQVLFTALHYPSIHDTISKPILIADSNLRDRFLTIASKQLKKDLSVLMTTTRTSADLIAKWSTRASRVLNIAQHHRPNDENCTKIYSLDFIGLGEASAWLKYSSLFFSLTMSVFQSVKEKEEMLSLLLNCPKSESHQILLAEILLSVSDGSSNADSAARAKKRQDRSFLLLEKIGGACLEKELLEQLTHSVVDIVVHKITTHKEGCEDIQVYRGIAVLSQLLELRFPKRSSCSPTLKAIEVMEGDSLWYVPELHNQCNHCLVKVVQVHKDDYPNYYYSIRWEHDGQSHERQTVIERLRRRSWDYGEASKEENSELDEAKRTEIALFLFDQLLQPFLCSKKCVWALGEVICVIIQHVEVGMSRGLGSLHYNIFQLVASMEVRFLDAIAKGDLDISTKILWSLAAALGFGLNCPSSSLPISIVHVNTSKLFEAIISWLRQQRMSNTDFGCSVLAWFITGLPSLASDAEQRNSLLLNALLHLFELSLDLMISQVNDRYKQCSLLACRAIHFGVRLLDDIKDTMVNDDLLSQVDVARTKALNSLIQFFSTQRNEIHSGFDCILEEDGSVDSVDLSDFPALITLALQKEGIRQAVAKAAAQGNNPDVLWDCLYDKWKRYHAFLLLEFVADVESRSNEVEVVQPSTDQKYLEIRRLTTCLDDEQADEIASVFCRFAPLIPLRIVAELKTWNSTDILDDDELMAAGRLLQWISFLRFVECVAPKDFSVRPAFVSYVASTEAVASILNLAVSHIEMSPQRKLNVSYACPQRIDELFTDSFAVDLPKLALMSLFKTVETFPYLARKWYEEDCPKVCKDGVERTMTNYIAPGILKLELDRIKLSPAFGPMTVTASAISREITASYVQDDFTLTVVIKLPPSFPFRSAEVDCSKTLGVPQNRWKRWSLQITMMLNNQCGTLQDALIFWKENVDKEFDGIEPCPVCFSVLHVKTHKLPLLECKTCHKRFHVDCLTQWFKSSGKNQCVLCQQPWSGTRV